MYKKVYKKITAWWDKKKIVAVAGSSIEIVPFRGYGTAEKFECRGRVLEYRALLPQMNDAWWRNALNNYRRFESDEVPDATLEFRLYDNQYQGTCDKEGYYHLCQKINSMLPSHRDKEWFNVHIDLKSTPFSEFHPTQATGEIFIPSVSAQYGFISDIDDTIMKTHVVSKTKMLYLTLFKNAFTRMAFDGVAAWYWALRKGADNKGQNPIFYVSNSPWNLYDLLTDFMHHNDVPKGPILLRDIVLPNSEKVTQYHSHKYNETIAIIRTYPHLKFVLIGDAGERDADIYLEIARIFPERVAGVLIRSVNDERRNKRVQNLLEQQDNVETLLFHNSLEAAIFCRQKDWIHRNWINAIQQTMLNSHSTSLMDSLIDEE